MEIISTTKRESIEPETLECSYKKNSLFFLNPHCQEVSLLLFFLHDHLFLVQITFFIFERFKAKNPMKKLEKSFNHFF